MKCLGREHKELERRGVTVLAISADPSDSHRRFAGALGLRFPLLTDAELETARSYGVYTPTPTGGFASRSVFLVDREGKLRHVDRSYAIPRALEGTALWDAVLALGETDVDPLLALEGLPEPERSGKTLLVKLVQSAIAEEDAAIDALLHTEFGARPGRSAEEATAARKAHLDAWRKTFADEDLATARFSAVMDLDAVKVLPRDAASASALKAFGSDVRSMAAGLPRGAVLVAVRCRGLKSDDGSPILSREIGLELRKEGDEWRIAALCGR